MGNQYPKFIGSQYPEFLRLDIPKQTVYSIRKLFLQQGHLENVSESEKEQRFNVRYQFPTIKCAVGSIMVV